MASKQKENKLALQLTKEEALVLHNWLSRINENNISNLFEDQSEQRISWDIEAMLEKKLAEPFEDNYLEILSDARKKVRDPL